jgi:hypothetical protein
VRIVDSDLSDAWLSFERARFQGGRVEVCRTRLRAPVHLYGSSFTGGVLVLPDSSDVLRGRELVDARSGLASVLPDGLYL